MSDWSKYLKILLVVLLLGVVACGSSSTTEELVSQVTQGTTEEITASIDGGIDLTKLSPTDLNVLGLSQLVSGSRVSKAADPTVFDNKVWLYKIGKAGELIPIDDAECTLDVSTWDELVEKFQNKEPLGFSCTAQLEPGFYVVRYVLLKDGKAVDLKADVEVTPTEVKVTGITVDPKVTVVVEALIKAILDATKGAEVDQAVITKIVDAVKDTIKKLVDSGVIAIPSLVAEVNATDADEVMGLKGEGVDVKSDQLEDVTGKILASDDVSIKVNEQKAGVMYDISKLTKEELIYRIFKELIGTSGPNEEGEDVPTYIKDFFVDLYKQNKMFTVADVLGFFANGTTCGQGTYYDMPVFLNFVDYKFNGDYTAYQNAALGNFTAFMKAFYAAREAGENATEEQKELLKETPLVVFGLFPMEEKDKWINVSADTVIDVPHALAIHAYLEGVFLEKVASDVTEKGAVEFCGFEPFAMLESLGFKEWAQSQPEEEKYSIDVLNIYTWEYDSVANVCVSNMDKMVDYMGIIGCIYDLAEQLYEQNPDAFTFGEEEYDNTTYYDNETYYNETLYPAQVSGCDETTMMNVFDASWTNELSVEVCYPSGECEALNATSDAFGYGPPFIGCWNVYKGPDAFETGNYTVKLYKAGQLVAEKTFYKKVIKDATKVKATLITPPDCSNSTTDCWVNPFSMPKAEELAVSWQEPDVSNVDIPEGVTIAYAMDVWGWNSVTGEDCGYWSTWDEHKFIYTTDYVIPVELKEGCTYQLYLNVVFVDTDTGEIVGWGGDTYSVFNVAASIDENATFSITGKVFVSDDAFNTYFANGTDCYAAVVEEKYSDEGYSMDILGKGLVDTTQCNATGLTDYNNVCAYKVDLTLGDFLNKSGSYFRLILFCDENSNGEVDVSCFQIGEVCDPWWSPGDWWSYPSKADDMWFDVWGGVLRVSRSWQDENGDYQYEEWIIKGNETIEGSDFYIYY